MGGTIRIGIGGWVFEPWRGTFYPEGLKQKDELAYLGEHLTAVEINATYYGTQKPATFANWAKAVPDGFTFAVKASRYCTNRRVLGEAGESIGRFVNQGLTELGDRLGPILWQFAPTKRFEANDFAAFLQLLPSSVAGVPLRHALEVRHVSFDDPDFFAMAKDAGAAVVYADHDVYPRLEGRNVGFSYARLMRAREDEPLGYDSAAMDRWRNLAQEQARKGDAFIFFISGAKVRAPAAAQGLIAALK